ncbi:saccharopine dehydrogenase NADP-binding domain-containing protein [Bosea sp. (in: a-proteobacteria)]|uniref:saccharopine dehydrogenase NADP-binding domain-containing protein n=1 Tax=Bosea sp. (in: a-proteobacteria) TaxID=1871050 RepID=UPI002FC697EF
MKTLMIYGAAGYTGSMVAEHARAAGLSIIVAGRSEAPLSELATKLGLPSRVFPADDPIAIAAALDGVDVLLNCAGPFMRTAEPMMRAAIAAGVHYLDVAAELDSYLLAEKLDADARTAGVMLLPGSGGSVAMLGSLASHAVPRIAQPRTIRIALRVTGSMSRGSAMSAAKNVMTETLVRRDGLLQSRGSSETRPFDFGLGEVDCFPLTLPDLITIGRSTGAPNVETFVRVSGDAFPEGDLTALPAGPDAQQRDASRYQAAVEVTGADGAVARSILDTVNGYSFTALAAAEAARRVLAGEVCPGFQTPAGLFGAGFAETIADTAIIDLPS